MLSTIANVLYVLIAIAMVVLILLQRGAGADAGASFGGGASGTVFGARGSANFLSRSTAVLAALFFLLSLAMGIFLARSAGDARPAADDLGVMSGLTTEQAPEASKPPVQVGDVPPAAEVNPAPASKGVDIGDVPAAVAPTAAPEAAEKSAAKKADEEKSKDGKR